MWVTHGKFHFLNWILQWLFWVNLFNELFWPVFKALSLHFMRQIWTKLRQLGKFWIVYKRNAYDEPKMWIDNTIRFHVLIIMCSKRRHSCSDFLSEMDYTWNKTQSGTRSTDLRGIDRSSRPDNSTEDKSQAPQSVRGSKAHSESQIHQEVRSNLQDYTNSFFVTWELFWTLTCQKCFSCSLFWAIWALLGNLDAIG